MAGIIKMVLSMGHGYLPQTLHAEEPSPHVDWSSGTVRLLTQGRAWSRNGHLRRAGVSSFGVSGTNAHVILEEGPGAEPSGAAAVASGAEAEPAGVALPFVLTAKSESGLGAQAGRLAAHLAGRPELLLGDVAYSLGTTRTQFEHRGVVVAPDRAGLLGALQALAAGEPAPATAVGRANVVGKVVFVFPGQGSQWVQMGAWVAGEFAGVRASVERVRGGLYPSTWTGRCVAVLQGEERAPSLERMDVVQPALFAVMVSLAEAWRSVGVKPDAVIGSRQR